jgi:predicted amidohydrolase YtcJ
MNISRWLSAVLLASFVLTGVAVGQDRVFYNAKIFTGEPDHPYAQALAIRGDKVVAVGNREEVFGAVDKNAEKIDLKGRLLLPGLVDCHSHSLEGGVNLISAEVSENISGLDELANFAADVKKNGRGMRGDILHINGIPLRFWSDTNGLNDRFSTGNYVDQPVYLIGMDGHTGWANKVLLQRAGITKQFVHGLNEIQRGYYGIGPDQELTGFLVDAGKEKVDALLSPPSKERLLEAGRAAVRHLHSLGITAWLDPATDKATLATYKALAQSGELTAHVGALPVIDFKAGHPEQQLQEALKSRDEFRNVPDAKVVGIKVFADGVVEYPSQTAVLSKPYRTTGRNGELLFDPKEFQTIAVEADKQGMIVHVHAIGDGAVTEALNGIEAARKANPKSLLPHTITHLQFISPADILRFPKLGVIASFQLYWASAGTDTIDLVKPHIDPEIYTWQYPARSLLDAGGIIGGASDWPVSTANVFSAIYQAETRRGPAGVLDADECVPREAMLYAYTRNAAKALGEEGKGIGSLAPGKQADFAVVDRDVLTVTAEEARDTRVLWTVFGGNTVYGEKP